MIWDISYIMITQSLKNIITKKREFYFILFYFIFEGT